MISKRVYWIATSNDNEFVTEYDKFRGCFYTDKNPDQALKFGCPEEVFRFIDRFELKDFLVLKVVVNFERVYP